MKKILIVSLFLYLNLLTILFASENIYQIEGTVIDAVSNQPISDVNIFLKGTTRGAASHVDGSFKITNIQNNSYTLVAHHIAYELYTENISLNDKNTIKIEIKLKHQIIKGEKVEVVAKRPKDWKHNINIFKREFIGTSPNASNCKLLNPEVIYFKKDNSNILHAYADSMLRVENQSLGYQLNIVLDEFRCQNNQLIYYSIYPHFKIMNPKTDKIQKKWDKNQKKTYIGSYRHFLYTLVTGNAENSNFNWFHIPSKQIDLKELTNKPLPPVKLDIIRYKATNNVSLMFPNYLVVIYGNDNSFYNWSILELRKPLAMLDHYGNLYTPEAIFLEGRWFRERVCDLLPIDFVLDYNIDIMHGTNYVIIESEIRNCNANNAYDAILELRPNLIHKSSSLRAGDMWNAGSAVVYLDQIHIGRLDELKAINTSQVKQIEYLPKYDATLRFGSDHINGAFLITTR